MAEAEPVQPMADRAAMHLDAMLVLQFKAQRIKGQIALIGKSLSDPSPIRRQFAAARIALALGDKRACLTSKLWRVLRVLQ